MDPTNSSSTPSNSTEYNDFNATDSTESLEFPEIREIFQMGNFSGFSINVKMNPELSLLNFIKVNQDLFSENMLLMKDVNSSLPTFMMPRGLEFLQPYTPVIDFIEKSTPVRPSTWMGQSNPTWNLRRVSERVKNTNS